MILNNKVFIFVIFLVTNPHIVSSTVFSQEEQKAFTEHRVIQTCIQDMGCEDYLSTDMIKSFTVSSTLKHPQNIHNVNMLSDNDPRTAWCEGEKGAGIGVRLQVEFSHPTRLKKILFSPMYAKSESTMINNNRPKWFTLMLDDTAIKLVVNKYRYNACGEAMPCDELLDMQSWTLPKELQKKPISKVELIIDAVVKGNKFDDTCMSELGFVGF